MGQQHTERLREWLAADYGNVTINEYGSVVVPAGTTTIICKPTATHDGDEIVQIEAPILVEVPSNPDLFELLTLTTLQEPFGACVVGGGEREDTVWIFYRATAYLDSLTADQLKRTVSLVYNRATAIADELRPVTGGAGLFDAR